MNFNLSSSRAFSGWEGGEAKSLTPSSDKKCFLQLEAPHGRASSRWKEPVDDVIPSH